MRYLLLLVLLYILYRLWRWLKGPEEGELVKDPNCGVYIPKGKALRVDIGGRTLYFCSRRCLEAYRHRGRSS